MKKKRFRFQWGALLMFVIYGGLFFLLFARIVYIQLTGQVEGEELKARAAALYQKEAVLTAERGKILDRNGNIVAEDTLSYKIVAVINPDATSNPNNPKHVIDEAKTAKVLAQYIDLEESEIYQKLMKKTRSDGKALYQVEFGVAGRGLSHETKSLIEKEELPGIEFISDTKRYYPNGPFASHLIGFAQKEQQEDGTFKTVGKMGLEYTYNKQLTGVNGTMKYESDHWDFLLPNSEKVVTPPKHGDHIYLTIDKTIQNFLDETMSNTYKSYKPSSMVAVVADAKTGEILAMTQRPTFDPDTRVGLDGNWLNEVTEAVIEPGSTMKIFTLASAIETGNWHPNAYYPSGKYTVEDRTIRDHNNVGWGSITYLEGIQRSSNTAIAYMLEQIGNETFLDYMKKFGFGQQTGIDLPGELSGTILTNYRINYVTTAYGQGSTVTPIQLVQAMTAVTNDGKMMQPYVIGKIVDSSTNEAVKESKPKVKGEPISAKTAKEVREILASTVTSKYGTAKKFEVEGYEVGGKTGTAQIARSDGSGRYLSGRNNNLFSFLGFAPVDDPQLIVYVAIKQPNLPNNLTGSDLVADVFTSVTLNSLKYLNINPDDTVKAEKIVLDNYVGKNGQSVYEQLQKEGLQPVIIGEGGEITDQYPKENLEVTKGNLVFLKTDGSITLPSFEKWSLRNLLVYKSLSGLRIEIVGEGYVESQNIPENTIIVDPTAPIVVNLKTPEEMYSSSD